MSKKLLLGVIACAVMTCPIGAEEDHRATRKVPIPWRADQLQRLSVDRPPVIGDPADNAGSIPIILAGDPNGTPPDSPELRVDANTAASPFAGTCALEVTIGNVTSRCSGAPVSPRHILTAAHCVDFNDDGLVDEGVSVSLIFNFDGDASLVTPGTAVQSIDVHPSFWGFDASVHDDLAIVTLVDPVPAGVPIYQPFRGALEDGQRVMMIGYGRSGDGFSGPIVLSSSTVKRSGENVADLFFADDDASGIVEIWSADFDAPLEGLTLGLNCIGGQSLGNDIETGAAGGDSGGPVFVEVEGQLQVWGTSTFVTPCTGPAFLFGSRSSGMLISAYLPWIDSIVQCAGNCNDCNSNGVPDGVDLLDDAADANGNGLIDTCELMQSGDLWVTGSTSLTGYSLAADGVVVQSDASLFSWGAVIATTDGRLLSVANDFAENGRGIYELNPSDGALVDILIPESGDLLSPTDMVVGPDGFLYVLNVWPVGVEPTITRHDLASGAFLETVVADDPETPKLEHGGLASPRKIDVGPRGNLYVADSFQEGVPHFDRLTGEYLGLFAPDGPDTGGFGETALDFHDDSLFVLRQGNVMRFDAHTGQFLEVSVAGTTISAFAIDIQTDGQVIYIVDSSNGVVRQFSVANGGDLGALLNPVFPTNLTLVPDQVEVIAADFDGDGDVDVADLVLLILAWGPCTCPQDLDGSGAVGTPDLVSLILSWG